MIKVEHIDIWGFKHAIRGMRNPMNSWDKSDSYETHIENPETMNTAPFQFVVGENDLKLMKKLYQGGPEHRKYLRQICVSMDITAPLYWWKEFDTYKVGTTADSCSTMHKIAEREFELSDFSCEHLLGPNDIPRDAIIIDMMEDPENPKVKLKDGVCGICDGECSIYSPGGVLYMVIRMLNRARELYLQTKDKRYWWQMIQLLPTSYNQKRTVTINYENVMAIIRQRTGHKLDEWNNFVDILMKLPYVEAIREEQF